jgi:hypothetical protein
MFYEPASDLALFCEVKRGFVDRWKIVHLKYITLSRVEISQFLKVFFPQNTWRTLRQHTCSSSKISMACLTSEEKMLLMCSWRQIYDDKIDFELPVKAADKSWARPKLARLRRMWKRFQ